MIVMQTSGYGYVTSPIKGYLNINNTFVYMADMIDELSAVCSGSLPDAFENNPCIIFRDEREIKKLDVSNATMPIVSYPYPEATVGIANFRPNDRLIINHSIANKIDKIIVNNKNVDYVKLENQKTGINEYFYGTSSLTINPIGVSYITLVNFSGNFYTKKYNALHCPYTKLLCINNTKNIPYTMFVRRQGVYYNINSDTHYKIARITGDAYLGRHGFNIYN